MIKTILFRGVGILLSLFVVVSAVNAQCPGPNDIDPPGFAWTHAAIPAIFDDGNGCTGIIDYCVRTLFPYPGPGETTYQSYILSITYDGCDPNLGTGYLFDIATEALFKAQLLALNPAVFPPCDGNYSVNHAGVLKPACWKRTAGSNVLHPCGISLPDQDAYCIFVCDICLNNGQFYRFNCTNLEHGTSECQENQAPAKLSDWASGWCYHIPCGTRPPH